MIRNNRFGVDFSDPRLIINMMEVNKMINDEIILNTDDMVEFALAVERRKGLMNDMKKAEEELK